MRISAISEGLQTPPPTSLYYTLSIMLFPNLYFFEGIADVTVNPILPPRMDESFQFHLPPQMAPSRGHIQSSTSAVPCLSAIWVLRQMINTEIQILHPIRPQKLAPAAPSLLHVTTPSMFPPERVSYIAGSFCIPLISNHRIF